MDLEQHVEAHLVKRVEALGGITAKMTILGRRGWPDRLVALGGLYLVELKRPKHGRHSATQVELHKKLLACGVEVVTLWSKHAVDGWIETLQLRGINAD